MMLKGQKHWGDVHGGRRVQFFPANSAHMKRHRYYHHTWNNNLSNHKNEAKRITFLKNVLKVLMKTATVTLLVVIVLFVPSTCFASAHVCLQLWAGLILAPLLVLVVAGAMMDCETIYLKVYGTIYRCSRQVKLHVNFFPCESLFMF